MSAVASGLSLLVAAVAYFGMGDGGFKLLLPIVACAAAAAWPTRTVVGVAMLATSSFVVMELETTGVLFLASVAALMLALNHLQEAATRIRRKAAAR